MIMGMYTDWGNLKVVSCVAWLNGAGPGSSTGTDGMGALGASISALSGPDSAAAAPKTQAENVGAAADWAMRETSGTLVSAFDSEAAGEFA